MNTPKDSTESLLPDLRRIADEIRVRIHLAGLDAKDVWATLETKLHDLEHKAQSATGTAKEKVGELATSLKRELHDLVDRLPGNNDPSGAS